MTIDNIVNISGNLKDAYKQVQPGTLRHVDELMNERRTNAELRTQWFYTGDGVFYFMNEKTPQLAMTREADNLVLRHIDDAFTQLTSTGNYCPDRAEADAAIKAPATEVFNLTQLKLTKENDEFSSMEISTTKYNKLNPEQRRLAERVYGQGDDFVANMAMLKEAKIDVTRVWVLNPSYVREHAKDSPLARASWLGDFFSISSFDAGGRSVLNYLRVRGVRREVIAVGDAVKNQVPSVPSEVKGATVDEILTFSREYVSSKIWAEYEAGMRQRLK